MISEHFSLEELTISQAAERAGIDNTPNAEILNTMINVLVPGLELVRSILGKPMHINSGYRSEAVNALIHGSRTSQHMLGEAADFICPQYGTPYDVCKLLQRRKDAILYDQLLLEFGVSGWTHVSFVHSNPRMQELTVTMEGGRVVYTPGIHS